MRVLVVEDDSQIARALRINLRARGHEVDVAETGAGALQAASVNPPDVVILDLGLPDLSGLDVIAGLRGWTEVAIIVLSGRTGSADKVAALDAGADDYMTKPFGMEELLARLRALNRRRGAGAEAENPRVRTGDITIDLSSRQVIRHSGAGDEPIRLTPTEWALLEALSRRPGALLSQRQLILEVWGPAYVSQPSNLRLYMTQLRRKLEPVPARPRYLLTEAGMGYRFQPDPAESAPT